MLSDRALFKTGLLVLAGTRAGGAGWASFHSNPEEEDRLRPAVQPARAYGYFLGLRAGRTPTCRRPPGDPPPGKRAPVITLKLDDGLSGRGGWGHDAVKSL